MITTVTFVVDGPDDAAPHISDASIRSMIGSGFQVKHFCVTHLNDEVKWGILEKEDKRKLAEGMM